MAGLGQRIKELRSRAGLSQTALARLVNIDVTYLSKLENDRQRASETVLRRLAEALEEDAAKLLVMAGRIPAELQPTFQASMLGDAAATPVAPPRYNTCFVARSDDRRRLELMLERRRESPASPDPGGSLVAVTGPPGCGKTRLAAEVAQGLVGKGRAIVWHAVREDDSDRIGAAAVLAHGAPESVLVLDDADRDLSASAATARRMVAAGVTVVATSRQPLGIQGQRLLPLESLPVPDRHQGPGRGDGPTPDPTWLQEQASVELFVDRASRVDPRFQLDSTTAPAVFDVCRWLDGLPLAIELAALLLRQMTVVDLAANVGGMLGLLMGRNTSDVPDRHASLTAAIEWSFEQLGERQRTVARRLSVFASTFTLDDAGKVAADDQHSAEFVVATVMDLVDRSLIAWGKNADGRAVYHWLRPIRQYAWQQLERAEDRDEILRRHGSWVLEVVDQRRRSEADWARFAELTPELVSTVYRLPASDQRAAMDQVADALTISVQFGNLARHAIWIDRQLSAAGPDVLREAGSVARIAGDYDAAFKNFSQKYEIARTDDDLPGQANSSLDLAENAYDRGDLAGAAEFLERATGLYEQLQDDRGRVEVLNLRGKIAIESADVTADQVIEAQTLFVQALTQSRAIEDRRLEAYSEQNLGVGDYLLRRIAGARSHLEVSLGLRQRMRNDRGQARVIEAFALIESQVGNHEAALQLLGAARQYRRSSGVEGIPPWWCDRLEGVEHVARLELGPEADQYLQDGAAMTLAAAGQLAMLTASERIGATLGNPAGAMLRRQVPLHIDRREEARVVADLDSALQHLVESGGSAIEAHRNVIRSKVLALAEPVTEQATDLLCFAVDPGQYRGVIVPVFTGAHALAAALERYPDWAERPVLEVLLDPLRTGLMKGETVVVNPWTPHEYRMSSAGDYVPSSGEETSTSASA